jgi:aryl-alcohol dehydrogenase-like predicted oxidoreductase
VWLPIAGTKGLKQLEESVAAAAISLDPAQMTALAPDRISGPRYRPTIIPMVDR